MKRFFARNTLKQTNSQRSASAVLGGNQSVRQFASSPQKNPYTGILQKLSVANNQYSFYNMTALNDKRICKNKLLSDPFPYLFECRKVAIFRAYSPRISDQKLR